MKKVILELKKLKIGYKGVPLINDINLTSNEGECIQIFGPNGTGKTCLFKTIIGIIPSLDGEIFFEDNNITYSTLQQRRKMGISLCPEGRMIFPNLTVEENLKTGLAIKGLFVKNKKQKLDEMYELFPKLYERRNQLGGTLSGGEQQMLALARAVIIEPKLLLLDEPLLGLSGLIIDDILKIIRDVAKKDGSKIVTEENEDRMKKVSEGFTTLKLRRC